MDNRFYTYVTPFGGITIGSNGVAITSIKTEESTDPVGIKEPDALIKKAAKQLDEYFSGKRKHFDLPLHTKGTEFQHKVWTALHDIPFGETRSYKQIAEAIGHPKAHRAVGMANNKNPIWIMIPCHRVIGADGSLTGYGGGTEMKKRLIKLEKK